MAFLDGGGVGNSSAKNQTTTKHTDARVVGGEGSINTSQNLDLSGVTVKKGGSFAFTSTDHGAVSQSLALALKGMEGAQAMAGQTLAANGSLLEGSLKMAAEQQQRTTDAIENIKTSDVRVLIVAGLAVVGIVGARMFAKG